MHKPTAAQFHAHGDRQRKQHHRGYAGRKLGARPVVLTTLGGVQSSRLVSTVFDNLVQSPYYNKIYILIQHKLRRINLTLYAQTFFCNYLTITVCLSP